MDRNHITSRLLTASAFAVISLVSTSASASLIDQGNTTYDTSSGLEWLDWTLTTQRSYDDVSSQFGLGDEFDGWRYATQSEVIDLYWSAGATSLDTSSTSEVAAAQGLMDLLGGHTIENESFSWAMYGSPDANNRVSTIGPEMITINGATTASFSTTGDSFFADGSDLLGFPQWDWRSFQTNYLGHALVKSATVPEPSTALLLGAGALLLAARKRTKKA